MKISNQTHMHRAPFDSEIARRNCDAVVIGAGLSGSLAAYELVRRGMTVLLLDRAAFPRPKVCGCCLNPEAQTILARVGLGQLTTHCQAVPLTALRLAARRRRARLPLAGWVALSRNRLDNALAESARQIGAIFLPGTTARVGASRVTGRCCTLHKGAEEIEIEASVVVAADGLGSRTLTRDVPGSVRVKSGSRIGSGVTIADATSDYESHQIYMANGSGGYVGLVRLEDGQLNLAAAFDTRFVQDCGGTGAAAARVLAEVGWPTPADLADQPWRGTAPLTHAIFRPASDRLLVVGDAAGYVEPFTGDGMAWAMTTATAVAALLDRGWQPGMDSTWANWHRHQIARRQRLIRAIAWTARQTWLARMAVGFVGQFPEFSRRMLARHLTHAPITQPPPPFPDRSREPGKVFGAFRCIKR